MSRQKREHSIPDDVPILMPQPTEGNPMTTFQLVNRYGTYEIQPTTDTENFFPSIGAGTLSTQSLHKLRRQTDIGADGDAGHGPAPNAADTGRP